MSPNQTVHHYKKLQSQGHDTWLRDCVSTKSLVASLELAALSRNRENRKHPHAFRIPDATLRAFVDGLIGDAIKILKSSSFDELYRNIYSHRVTGIGSLAIYDTAHRIGARLKLQLQVVYMHRGTKSGAENYLGRRVREKILDRSQFPDFAVLSCARVRAGNIRSCTSGIVVND